MGALVVHRSVEGSYSSSGWGNRKIHQIAEAGLLEPAHDVNLVAQRTAATSVRFVGAGAAVRQTPRSGF